MQNLLFDNLFEPGSRKKERVEISQSPPATVGTSG
jgi:hypothetical protein